MGRNGRLNFFGFESFIREKVKAEVGGGHRWCVDRHQDLQK